MKNTLHIIKDNEEQNLTIEDVFNTQKYDQFIGITFSISTSFINKYISKFNNIELIVGIQEPRIHKSTNLALNNITDLLLNQVENEPSKIYQTLSTNIKEKMANQQIIFKTPFKANIHSKFYLLKNSKTNDTRLILGSTNLSEQAFNNHTAQFENILIYDNSPLYDIYLDYYNYTLSEYLTNYMPNSILKANVKKIQKVKDKSEDPTKIYNVPITLNDSELDQAQEQGLSDTIENIRTSVSEKSLPENFTKDLENSKALIKPIKQQHKEKEENEKITYSLMSDIIGQRNGIPHIKTKQSITKHITKKLNIRLHDTTQNDEESPILNRPLLTDVPEERNESHSGLIYNDKTSDKGYDFGEYTTTEDIKNSLLTIDQFINTFKKYAVNYSNDYGSRIMESILYTFATPFMTEIRLKARSDEERNDIPMFLFLGGQAGSGKSSLLKILSKMTGLYPKEYKYIDYSSIVPTGGQRKSKIINIINHCMTEQNVNPLFLDEMTEDFFEQSNKGNELIRNISNQTAKDPTPTPALIGTTNAANYSLRDSGKRRSYYLKVDKVFDEQYRQDSQPEYNEIYNNINNTLFKDFILRFAKRLDNDNLQWDNFQNSDKIDFLYHVREIFKEYYNETGLLLPKYFPESRYDDSGETDKEKWRKLFEGSSNQYFSFIESTGTLIFKISSIDENHSRQFGIKPSDKYRMALSPKVIKGDIDGEDIELNATDFFNWIGINNPYITHYKDKLFKLYQDKPTIFSELKNNKNFIKLKTFHLSETNDENTIQQFIKHIPDGIVTDYNKESHTIIMNKENLFVWLGVEPPKKGLIKRFMK